MVRSGKWKLHILSPGGIPERGEDYVDPRGPDGVTLIAPYEQARPSAYPGVMGGDGPKDMMLFDLEKDPSEQLDVSGQYPDVVARLHGFAEPILATMPEFSQPKRYPSLRRITGGRMDSYLGHDH
jgi:hypothetical protein